MKLALAALGALVVAAGPVGAAPKTVTLSVPGMNCAACPLTVKKALTRVDGVTRAEVSLDQRLATVTYDDTRADVDALLRATRDAGYPSRPAQDPRR